MSYYFYEKRDVPYLKNTLKLLDKNITKKELSQMKKYDVIKNIIFNRISIDFKCDEFTLPINIFNKDNRPYPPTMRDIYLLWQLNRHGAKYTDKKDNLDKISIKIRKYWLYGDYILSNINDKTIILIITKPCDICKNYNSIYSQHCECFSNECSVKWDEPIPLAWLNSIKNDFVIKYKDINNICDINLYDIFAFYINYN